MGKVRQKRAERKASQTGEPVARPWVMVSGEQLSQLIEDARRVVMDTNDPPEIFTRGGRLARISRLGRNIAIAPLGHTEIYGELARRAEWLRRVKGKVVAARPPRDVAEDLVANPDPRLPRLEALVRAPTYTRDGRLVVEPGYDAQSGIYYAPPQDLASLRLPPKRPTRNNVRAALDLFRRHILVDFPFVSEHCLARALAAILLPFVRLMIDGPTPIILLESSVHGAGKGLFVEAAALIRTGAPPRITMLSDDPAEVEKKLFSLLLEGHELIDIDNVQRLDSAHLAAVATARTVRGRLLGTNKTEEVENDAIIVVTSNNPAVSGEMARRCLVIRIAPSDERPWLRRHFRHPQLRTWILQNRCKLVAAALVLVENWSARGRPRSADVLGSFEEATGIIGGILQAAGVEGRLVDVDGEYEAADLESEEWRRLVHRWTKAYGSRRVSATMIHDVARTHDLLADVLGDGGRASQLSRLGKALSRQRDRVFGNKRIVVGRNASTKSAEYRLEDVTPRTSRRPPGPKVRGSR